MTKLYLTVLVATIGTALACADAPTAPTEVPVDDYNVQETPHGAGAAAARSYTLCQYRGGQHSREWSWYTTAGDKKGSPAAEGVRMWTFGGWACGHNGTQRADGTYCGGWSDTHEWVYVTNPCG